MQGYWASACQSLAPRRVASLSDLGGGGGALSVCNGASCSGLAGRLEGCADGRGKLVLAKSLLTQRGADPRIRTLENL